MMLMATTAVMMMAMWRLVSRNNMIVVTLTTLVAITPVLTMAMWRLMRWKSMNIVTSMVLMAKQQP